jgi:hypothetical protein
MAVKLVHPGGAQKISVGEVLAEVARESTLLSHQYERAFGLEVAVSKQEKDGLLCIPIKRVVSASNFAA